VGERAKAARIITLTETDMNHTSGRRRPVQADNIDRYAWDYDFAHTDLYFKNGGSTSVLERPAKIAKLIAELDAEPRRDLADALYSLVMKVAAVAATGHRSDADPVSTACADIADQIMTQIERVR
jgi:hypothetical protein